MVWVNSLARPPRWRFFFYNDRVKPLVGQTEGRGHTRDAATDDQGTFVNGDFLCSQWPQKGGPCHCHADKILGLVRCRSGVVAVHPRILVPDIGHLEKELVQTASLQGLLKEGFMGSWRAGGYHHPVQVVFLNQRLHAILGVLSAGKKVLLHMNHVGKGRGVFDNARDIDDASDVGSAVADEYA